MVKGKEKEQAPSYLGEKEYKIAMEENKKWMHKEIERQRRQEMGKVCNTLRSLLPLEYIKGKRSTSDHVHEAMNYINHLQDKVKQLLAKRDELTKVSNLSTIDPYENGSSTTHLPPFVLVHPCPGGLEIMCSYSFKNSVFPLSRVLDMLLKEGLNVDLIHPNMTETGYSELRRKLTEAISSSSLQETLSEPENC